MDFHQNAQPESNNDNQDNANITPNDCNSYNSNPYDNSAQNINNVSSQEQQAYNCRSYENSIQNMNCTTPQDQPSNGNGVQPQSPYQGNAPYGSSANAAPNNAGYPDIYNNNSYNNGSGSNYNNNSCNNSSYNNNSYDNIEPNIRGNSNNGYNNYINNSYNNSYSSNGSNYNNNGVNNGAYPNYGRGAYGMPVSEPGGGLATAAMILGVVSIISCFTFTVYPAFITGSIAIVLAVLSKGRRPMLLSKAKTGITCAVIGLISNTVLIISFIVMFFTVPEVRAQVNQTCMEQYGKTFDEMMEEILEDSGYGN